MGTKKAPGSERVPGGRRTGATVPGAVCSLKADWTSCTIGPYWEVFCEGRLPDLGFRAQGRFIFAAGHFRRKFRCELAPSQLTARPRLPIHWLSLAMGQQYVFEPSSVKAAFEELDQSCQAVGLVPYACIVLSNRVHWPSWITSSKRPASAASSNAPSRRWRNSPVSSRSTA